jgi:hypothetical protein
MNCKDFEEIVVELVRGEMMDAGDRQAGLSHIADCRRCAARLAEETRLNAALRGLRLGDATLAAPPAVESSLMNAYRGWQNGSVVSQAHHVKESRRWMLAAAAVVIAALGVALGARQWSSEVAQPSSPTLPTSRAPSIVPTAAPFVVPAQPSPELPHSGFMASSMPQRETRRSQPVATTHALAGDSSLSMDVVADRPLAATDFLPVTMNSDQPPLESGQVVRVAMPRGALISYGLPVNPARANEAITAELLLGPDGQARAIRLVR